MGVKKGSTRLPWLPCQTVLTGAYRPGSAARRLAAAAACGCGARVPAVAPAQRLHGQHAVFPDRWQPGSGRPNRATGPGRRLALVQLLAQVQQPVQALARPPVRVRPAPLKELIPGTRLLALRPPARVPLELLQAATQPEAQLEIPETAPVWLPCVPLHRHAHAPLLQPYGRRPRQRSGTGRRQLAFPQRAQRQRLAWLQAQLPAQGRPSLPQPVWSPSTRRSGTPNRLLPPVWRLERALRPALLARGSVPWRLRRQPA
jgi:hypothetical protein